MQPFYLAIDAGASYYGWGVCYENLKREFSKRTALRDVKLDVNLQKGKHGGSVFHGITDHFMNVSYPQCIGDRNFAYTFFEAELDRKDLERLNRFDLVFAGSSWCVDKLRDLGVSHARPLIQGVDIEKFYPIPVKKQKDVFTIFSGGKFELRKGQDLVIAAFKVLQHRYKDIELVTLWQNAWPTSMQTMSMSKYIYWEQPPDSEEWLDTVAKTFAQNRIFPNRVTHYGFMPNREVMKLIAHSDVGVFPNRCEGGTNLMLMEYMACGKPAIVSTNSGHLDLIRDANCIQLKRNEQCQIFLNHHMVFDWREPELDELISAIEFAYHNRDAVQEIGRNARKTIVEEFQWRHGVEKALFAMEHDSPNGRYSPMFKPRCKAEFPWLFNQLGLLGQGVEVGVYEGEYSELLLNEWNGRMLFLVDRWKHIDGWTDRANDDQELQDERFDKVKLKFGSDLRARIIRLDSVEASKLFPDESLDWVFIDADHTVEGCSRDINAFFPKLKPGGVLCGHDYLDGDLEVGKFGVKSAVDEFASKHGYAVNVTNELVFPSWWFIK